MKGYQDPRWLTFRQIADEDGKYHAGLITEKEYTATLNSVLEMKPKEKALER